MLNITGLSKIYNEKKVVDDISFNVGKGRILGIIGPNGSGKTTTLQMITGIVNSNQGDCIYNGFSIKKDPEKYKSNIAFIADELNLYPNLLGREYVDFICRLWGAKKNYKKKMKELAEMLGMEQKLDFFISSYSKGMRQKIAFIAALSHEPTLLILDEPFNGLDPETMFSLKKFLITYINQGNSIVLSSHLLDTVEKICTDIIMIKEGKKVYDSNDEYNSEKFSELEELYNSYN
ncbi:ABC transporter ATP-binding protein [Bacillus siamensis]|uniref:ABC transporter ATP-binding protein n=1 Tax=Bacillus TaxID=1386 RepID=UPI002E1E391D|nr:ABC transporter ATP-binding protein [Bacillus siamensis]MED0777952.1 ABC transporter ATP-binding protein [Bacillus siamensis]MED0781881.1 ABC transporter ATP-binding protein [Bacillus siamensis]MED0836464.1 ABC transporter ATP-binding protein [Bacillus siamensis]